MRDSDNAQGLMFGLGAFLWWGLAPIYFKQLENESAWTILSHRVVWSCLLLLLAAKIFRSSLQLKSLFTNKKLGITLALSTFLIGFNWFLFTWAVINERILETSLGYFINPLVNVIFGLVFFNDKLRPLQWIAIVIAALGVLYQVILVGYLPWIALGLALSFACYGLVRKKIPVDALSGLTVESLLLLPFALVFFIVQTGWPSTTSLAHNDFNLWLLLAGLITIVPLFFFNKATKLLSLPTLGILQYIAPSIAFSIAVFIYNEPLTEEKMLTFILIWVGICLYSFDTLKQRKA
ncbi:MAG: EamA family transporter RarD [Pseudomonadota bacterium]